MKVLVVLYKLRAGFLDLTQQRNYFFLHAHYQTGISCTKIEIHNTQFIGTPKANKFIIKTTLLTIILNKSQFTTKNQNRSFTGASLINSELAYTFVAIETTFDSSESVVKNNFPVLAIQIIKHAKFINTHILCPMTYRAAAVLNRHYHNSYIVSCKAACEMAEYTYDGGNMVISGELHSNKDTNSLDLNITKPGCNACPVGAKCEGNIKSLPNYWGYKNNNGDVTMIRCPDGYYCQNDHTCQGISSCQKGRTGTLCGSCIENLTESLISPKCIDSSTCHTVLVLVMYFLASLSYAVGLLTINSIKKKTLQLLKKLLKLFRKKSI